MNRNSKWDLTWHNKRNIEAEHEKEHSKEHKQEHLNGTWTGTLKGALNEALNGNIKNTIWKEDFTYTKDSQHYHWREH